MKSISIASKTPGNTTHDGYVVDRSLRHHQRRELLGSGGWSKIDWFKEFLELPNEIPSHDTFGRLLARINPKGFHTFDKSNEITAIPELIKTLALEGAIVTIDAMGCQKKITQTIVDAGADYVIQVKDNQKNLHEDIALFFQEPTSGPFDIFETLDGEHGRIETRRYFTTSDIDWLPGKEKWTGINTISMAVRERDVNGEISIESSYFISSLENHASTIAKSIRGIENGLHWCLDISFR